MFQSTLSTIFINRRKVQQTFQRRKNKSKVHFSLMWTNALGNCLLNVETKEFQRAECCFKEKLKTSLKNLIMGKILWSAMGGLKTLKTGMILFSQKLYRCSKSAYVSQSVSEDWIKDILLS